MAKMNKMLKQAQRMQNQLAEAQKEIQAMTRTFSVGGGAVSVTARGDHTLESVDIKPDAVDPEDIEGLEDMLMSAVNGAMEEIRSASEEKMSGLTQGFNIPGLL